MIVYLCKKLGITKEYIEENLTVQQIRLFYEESQKQRLEDIRLQATVLFQTINCAMAGTVDKFKDMLNKLEVDYKEDIDKQLGEGKKAGFPIEEH